MQPAISWLAENPDDKISILILSSSTIIIIAHVTKILSAHYINHYYYNCSSANSANRLRTTPFKFIVALPEKVLNFSTI